MFFFPDKTPSLDPLDFLTLSFIVVLLFLSSVSLFFIFYLCVRSRFSPHLLSFNSLWTIRFIFVLFVSVWSLTHLLHTPLSNWREIFPVFSSAGLLRQQHICTIQFVLSLGFFQPGFLVSLLVLINASINKAASQFSSALASVLFSCLPVLALQLFFLVFSPFELLFLESFYRSSVVFKNPINQEDTVLCTFPLIGTIVFAAFGAVYSFFFLRSCRRLLSLVINKALRVRIYTLAVAVMLTLPVEIFFLTASAFWTSQRDKYRFASLMVFLGALVCAAVGEGILVIKPILDSLATVWPN